MPSMIPISHLLNPVSPEPSDASSDETGPTTTTTTGIGPTTSSSPTSPSSSSPSSKSKPWPTTTRQRGPVNYMPHEHGLSTALLADMSVFHLRPFGHIRQSCEHIPYNSSKKDFFGKTGRESIDVLKYEFRPRGALVDYTVMWDYDVGLVRITPFFKCLGYAKTKPSQMLDKNPGLRDITPSITGGAVSAQGYWMPFKCAKAVCATFCYNIAPALVPLFGPAFPAECRVPGSPGYRDMTIDPRIIHEATREAAMARSMRGVGTTSTQQQQRQRLAQPVVSSPPPPSSSSWKAINSNSNSSSTANAKSPMTPPRSSNGQRGAADDCRQQLQQYHHHQNGYVHEAHQPDEMMVMHQESSYSQHHPHHPHHQNHPHHHHPHPHHHHHDQHHHHHHNTTYLKRRLVSPVIVHFNTAPNRQPPSAAQSTRNNNSNNSPRKKRTHRQDHDSDDDDDNNNNNSDDQDARRPMRDYHAASLLVGLQGEARTCRPRSRG